MLKTSIKTGARTLPAREELTINHGGSLAWNPSKESELEIAVAGCFLFQDQFYESGEKIADRIFNLALTIEPEKVAALAVKTRHVYNMRHVPLMLLVALGRTASGIPHLLADTIEKVINRPDEMGDLLALYWEINGANKPVPAQFKKGLVKAVAKFDAYQLTKNDKPGAKVRSRDVIFLTHPNPGQAKERLFANFVNKDHYPKELAHLGSYQKLDAPNTWEVRLSAGEDKKDTWEDLLRTGKLGATALLSNLRGMVEAKVDTALIHKGLAEGKGFEKIHPFKFFAAAKHAPSLEAEISDAMLHGLSGREKLKGKTVVIVDVSGSMYGGSMSAKSEMNRAQAACSMAAVLREVCQDVTIWATAGSDGRRIHDTKQVPSRRGIPLVEAIYGMSRELGGGGIFLKQVNEFVFDKVGHVDRYICITDEQDTSGDRSPFDARIFAKYNYMLNVASYQPSIAYDSRWIRIGGFSDALVDYILNFEKLKTRYSQTA